MPRAHLICSATSFKIGALMSNRVARSLARISVALVAALMLGCGSNGGPIAQNPTPGSVVLFGTDTPICSVESFLLTITSWNLGPQSGTWSANPPLSAPTPATVDFGRLTGFTNIVSTASVPPGTYSQLQITLSNPQLMLLSTSSNPPTPQFPATILTATTLTLPINPALVVTSGSTIGLTLDFNLLNSVQVGTNGQATGTVNPQITVTNNSSSGSAVGEADAIYGIAGAASTANPPNGFTGSFSLTVGSGAGQALTVWVNSNTVFEGDGVNNLSAIAAGTFVEVDAIVNTSGQIVAQLV